MGPHIVPNPEGVDVVPPIQDITSLHRDILWNVFMLNADMDAPTSSNLPYSSARGTRHFVFSALTVLRCTSQVCRSWRAIILESPSLWSRVIDLYVLRASALQWRNEVMKRTGKALLHVQGCLSMDHDEDLFMWLIGAFRTRIRDLNLIVQDPNHNRSLGISWDFLQSPAISLESFKLQINGILPEAITDSSFSLFSNNAPALRSYFHIGIPFTIEAPWLSHLCRLYLCSEIHLHLLLEILSRTPFLEWMKIEERALAEPEPGAPIRHANLNYLKDISISAPLSRSVCLLDRIIPAPGCRLCLHTDPRILSEPDMLVTIESVFTRYCHYYFDSNSPRHLSLELYSRTLLLSAHLQPTQKATFPDFVLSVRGQERDIIPIFLSSFSSCNLKSVTHLDLLINPGVSHQNLESLLFSLTSVHTLSTTPNALRMLNDYEDFWALFPLLHTISFPFYLHSGVGDVEEFLFSRKEFGPSTIRTLDFRRCEGLSTLHPFEDVEVLWKRRDVIKERDCKADL